MAEARLERQRNGVKLVRKGGLEPPRPCGRQPLKHEEIAAERSRPRNIGVGCHSSGRVEAIRSRLSPHGLQILARHRPERDVVTFPDRQRITKPPSTSIDCPVV